MTTGILTNLIIVAPLFFLSLWIHERGHLRGLNLAGKEGKITYGWHEWGVEYEGLTFEEEQKVLELGLGVGMIPLGLLLLLVVQGVVDSWLVLGAFVLYFVASLDDIRRLIKIEKSRNKNKRD